MEKAQSQHENVARNVADNARKVAPTKFQTELEKLRKAIETASAQSTSVEQFQRILQEEHGITVKESRGRWSYLPEGRERPITWRKLGEAYKKESIEAAIAANLQREIERQAQPKQPQPEQENVLAPLSTTEEICPTSAQHDEPVNQPQQAPTPQVHHAPDVDEDFFLYGRIIDLNSPKVQETYSLLQWSKIQNLKENAHRFAYITENGLLNVDRLATELSRTRKAFYQKQSQQVAVEKRLKEVNGLLRDMAAFYETKEVYNQYMSIKNPRKQKQFYAEHEQENKSKVCTFTNRTSPHGRREDSPLQLPLRKAERR